MKVTTMPARRRRDPTKITRARTRNTTAYFDVCAVVVALEDTLRQADLVRRADAERRALVDGRDLHVEDGAARHTVDAPPAFHQQPEGRGPKAKRSFAGDESEVGFAKTPWFFVNCW